MNMRKNVLVAALALGGIAFAGTSVAAGDAPTTAPAAQSQMKQSAMNWFGGESYNGAPALTVTAALVKAGGGASNFSFSTALVSMLGQKTVNAEVAKLTKQYGHENVTNFINGMTFAVNDGLKRATEAGVKLLAELRKAGVAAETDYAGKSLKAQMRSADRERALVVRLKPDSVDAAALARMQAALAARNLNLTETGAGTWQLRAGGKS